MLPSLADHLGTASDVDILPIMLAAYLDDTGTHADSEAVGIFGMISANAEWARFEQSWKRHLRSAGVSWFHASHCENRQKEFERKERHERDALVRNLIEVMGKYRVVIVGAATMRADWNDVMPTDVKAGRFRGNPFYFCFEHCMQQICKWSEDHAGGEPVALVFAEQQEYQEYVTLIHRVYQNSKHFIDRLGSFTTANPRSVIPLQAADLVAYESFIHLRSKVKSHPMRWQVRKLLEVGVENISQFHDRESLTKMLTAPQFIL